jgi:heme exporter protein C
METKSWRSALGSAALLLLMLGALYTTFLWVPTERTMGHVQRIFYFHMPSAMTAAIAFFLVFVSGIAYLVSRRSFWDRLALSSAEIGLAFIAITLITGPIWARPVWGIWWTWDARLTTTLILGLIYLAYLMLRACVLDKERRATLAAVVGIIGFVDVPLVFFSIRWFRTQHPQPVLMGGEGSGLAPEMRLNLLLCMIAFLVLFSWLLRLRYQVETLSEEVESIRQGVLASRGES